MKAERAYPRFTITAKGTRWVEGGHPWIYAQEIVSAPEGVENGALVDAVSEKGKYLGSGFFSRESKIRIRLLSRNANDRFDADFWRRRIRYAWDYRKTVMGADVSCCRVIFGEADGFPGLTVDRFENLLVTQTLSVGMERIKEMLFPLLVEVLAEDGVVIDGVFERNDAAIRALEGMEQGKGWFPLEGRDVPTSAVTEICENGVYYRVDVENGQKTGFFLDQKYNRLAVARLATRPPRARLLHPHRLLCAQRRAGRRGARHRRGHLAERHRHGPRERRAQWAGGPHGLPDRGRVRPSAPSWRKRAASRMTSSSSTRRPSPSRAKR